MARIRPGGTRQQVRQPINPNLPDTGPVMVDLEAAGPEKPTLVYGSSAYAMPPDQLKPSQTVALDQPPDKSPVTSLPLDYGEDDADVSLRKTRERVKSRREQNLEAQNQQLQNWGQQQATEAAVAKHEKVRSDYDTVASALAQAEADAAQAEQDYANAWAKGDGLGVAKAQRALSKAEFRINTLQVGKDELEVAVKQPPRVAAPPVNTAAAANFEKILEQLRAGPNNPNGLQPNEEEWVRAHPDSIEPHNQNHLRVAFEASQRKGLRRGSQEYFDFLSERLGFDDESTGAAEPEYEEEPVRQAPEPRQRYAAPPSRSGGGNAGSLPPGKIMLTEAQRQIARMSMPGLPAREAEVEYARGLQKLMDSKRQGLYPSG